MQIIKLRSVLDQHPLCRLTPLGDGLLPLVGSVVAFLAMMAALFW
jgi:hypothetical protein